jgi:hypothetical protein
VKNAWAQAKLFILGKRRRPTIHPIQFLENHASAFNVWERAGWCCNQSTKPKKQDMTPKRGRLSDKCTLFYSARIWHTKSKLKTKAQIWHVSWHSQDKEGSRGKEAGIPGWADWVGTPRGDSFCSTRTRKSSERAHGPNHTLVNSK